MVTWRRRSSGVAPFERLAVVGDGPGRGRLQEIEQAQQGGLAGAAGADQRQDLAVAHVQRIDVQHGAAGVDLAQPAISVDGVAHRFALQAQQRHVGQEGQGQQDDAQGDGQGELALPGVEHDGGGQHPGLALDVAAHQHHRADLGDDAAEGRHDGRHHAQARLPQHGPVSWRPVGAQGAHLQASAGSTPWTAAMVRPVTSGKEMMVWATIMARGVKSQPSAPSGPLRESIR